MCKGLGVRTKIAFLQVVISHGLNCGTNFLGVGFKGGLRVSILSVFAYRIQPSLRPWLGGGKELFKQEDLFRCVEDLKFTFELKGCSFGYKRGDLLVP